MSPLSTHSHSSMQHASLFAPPSAVANVLIPRTSSRQSNASSVTVTMTPAPGPMADRDDDATSSAGILPSGAQVDHTEAVCRESGAGRGGAVTHCGLSSGRVYWILLADVGDP